MSNTHEHLEHAEHAQHALHDPFTARVALTIAVIAAVLAAVTLLSHRAHNETLQAQIEAGILQTQASDQWAFFQAKNIRQHEYRAYSDLLGVVAKEPGKENPAAQLSAKWTGQVDKYESKDLPELKGKAEALEAESRARRRDSEDAHHRAARLDLGELAVELGLVLCSIAVLTRRRGFWFAGIAAAVVGALLAATAFFLAPHAEGHEGPGAEHRSTETGQKPAEHAPEKH
jgi:hypothetical protein